MLKPSDGFESSDTARYQKPFSEFVMSVLSRIRNEMYQRLASVSYSTLGSLEKMSVATPKKVFRLNVDCTFPLLSKILPTVLVTSTTLLGPAATEVLGGSHPAPHSESGNPRPPKLVSSAGVVVNASVANDGISGSAASIDGLAASSRFIDRAPCKLRAGLEEAVKGGNSNG